ncbi:MAG: hypothetical protein KAH30_03995, partial [Caldisericia bacterium]|nr:hypothetical protein [Caldisericia bacterium]
MNYLVSVGNADLRSLRWIKPIYIEKPPLIKKRGFFVFQNIFSVLTLIIRLFISFLMDKQSQLLFLLEANQHLHQVIHMQI